MPAARRSGMTTPCAPNAAALRIAAPRLRGSVTWSSATTSGGSPSSFARTRRSSGWAYSYAGMRAARPWCTAPVVIRSSSPLVTSSRLMPRSLGEPERLAQPAVALGALGDVDPVDRDPLAQRLDHGVAAGDPLGVAGVAPLRPRRRGLGRLLLRRLVCLVVGPVLGLGRRPLALEAALDPAAGARGRASCVVLRIEPLRCELPGHVTDSLLPHRLHFGPCGGVLDLDAGGLDLVADRVGGGEVLGLARGLRAARAGRRRARRRRRSASASAVPVLGQAGSSGSRPSTSSIARTCPAAGAGVLARGELPVALAHRVVEHRDRGRRAEVVVHRRGERLRQLARLDRRRPGRGSSRSAGSRPRTRRAPRS